MSGDVVNLRRARKARDRAAAKAEADARAARHGASRVERLKAEAEAAALRRTLDGARREPRSPETRSATSPSPESGPRDG